MNSRDPNASLVRGLALRLTLDRGHGKSAELAPELDLGGRLLALRTALKLSQRELAEEWGIAPASIAKWERGVNALPGPVRKLLELYEADLAGERPSAADTDANFLSRGFNGILAYGVWVFFRRVFGMSGGAPSTAAQEVFARQFANHLAQHHSLLTKLGQRALYLNALVGPAERAALAKLRDPRAPLRTATVHRLFRETFGAEPTKILEKWSPRPKRRGSIGQVHKARLKDGREVAVKVQYPDSRAAMEADLVAAPLMDRWLTKTWPGQPKGVIFEEMRERFLEECDYEREAENIRRFRPLWAGDERAIIPATIDELCKGPFLTTEWCDGVAWPEWIPNATVEDRRRFAEVVWDFYHGSVYAHGIVNADPHVGNFLFLENKTALIDFGCVKIVSESFHHYFRSVSRAVCERRWLDVARLAVDQGLADADAEPDTLPRMCVWMFLPMLLPGKSRVSSEYLRALLDVLTGSGARMHAIRMNRDTVFLHHVQMATYAMLADLDVAVDYRARLNAQLYPDAEPPPPFRPAELATFGIELSRLGMTGDGPGAIER